MSGVDVFFVWPPEDAGNVRSQDGEGTCRQDHENRVLGRGKYISSFTFLTCTSPVSEMHAVCISRWLSRVAEDGNSPADL